MSKDKDKGKRAKNGGDGPERMKRKDYEDELRKLQVKLCHLQEWVNKKGLRVIIAFEGRDAAGKGGTIRAIAERVSPRVFRIVALPALSERQKSQLFMQRYIEQFRGRRSRDFRPQLVQSCWCRARDGLRQQGRI